MEFNYQLYNIQHSHIQLSSPYIALRPNPDTSILPELSDSYSFVESSARGVEEITYTPRSPFFFPTSLTLSPLLFYIMSASALLKSRVRRPSYLKKLAKPEDLLHHFPNGTYIGWSGFTGVGYPKYVTQTMRSRGQNVNLNTG